MYTPLWKFSGFRSTLLPPPLNNRFELIGQLLAPPPLKAHYAAPFKTLQPHLPFKKKNKKPRRKPVVFNLYLEKVKTLLVLFQENVALACSLLTLNEVIIVHNNGEKGKGGVYTFPHVSFFFFVLQF